MHKKDSDGRERINRARLTGKDGDAGRLLSQLSGRQQQMDSRIQNINISKQRTTNFWLTGSTSKRNLLIESDALQLPLGQYRTLNTPPLRMAAGDRIAITGANGLGKSTLLHAIHPNVPEQRLIFLPQEISSEQSRATLLEIKALPKQALGKLMTIVSCLGSDPKSVLASKLPSPGEIRKLMLALGMSKEPWLIIMDEPTNHLDLPSIEALEAALQDCPFGLLLVSHDENFLGTLVDTYWHLSEAEDGSGSILEIKSPAKH